MGEIENFIFVCPSRVKIGQCDTGIRDDIVDCHPVGLSVKISRCRHLQKIIVN